MPLIHAFSSSKADGGDSTLVQPSNWNAAHVVTSGGLNFASLTGAQEPTTPNAGSLTVYSRQRANRNLLNVEGPSGLGYPLQPMFGVNRISVYMANPNATTSTVIGMAAPATSGTAAAANVTTTNFSSSLIRIDYPSAGTANQYGGLRGAIAAWQRSATAGMGGVYFVGRWIQSTAGTNNRVLVGFYTGTIVPPASDPSAHFNTIMVGKDAADANYQFMVNDGAGAATKTNTNIPVVAGDVMEARIFWPPGSSSVNLSLECIASGGTGSIGSGLKAELTGVVTNIPAQAVLLNWQMHAATSNTTAARIAPISVYIESDY